MGGKTFGGRILDIRSASGLEFAPLLELIHAVLKIARASRTRAHCFGKKSRGFQKRSKEPNVNSPQKS
jgi:hypothetical protein